MKNSVNKVDEEASANAAFLRELLGELLKDAAVTSAYRKKLLAGQYCLSNLNCIAQGMPSISFEKVMAKYNLWQPKENQSATRLVSTQHDS